MRLPLPLATVVALLLAQAPTAALAAESYDSCAGTITSLPAVITTQGVWCLKDDLVTNQSSGKAITVQANNVTIDCNGFKIGGLAGGPGTTAIGVDASGRSNFTMRGCNVRGFATGLYLDPTSGGGHVIEDNRFDGNLAVGIHLYGDGSVIRRNQIVDTGVGSTLNTVFVCGIRANGNIDVLDNQIATVLGDQQIAFHAMGVFHEGGTAAVVAGNRISGITRAPSGFGFGVAATSIGLVIRDNNVIGDGTSVFAFSCTASAIPSVVKNNAVLAFAAVQEDCSDGGGNTLFN